MENNVNDFSRIAAGTVIKGEITSPSDLRIDGMFQGKIVSKGKVTVGDKAVIQGDIICQNVDFAGTMKGNFYVKDTLSLRSAGKVDGDLNTRRLQMELDATFNGNCRMITEADFAKLTEPLTGAQPRPAQPAQPAQAQQQAPRPQQVPGK